MVSDTIALAIYVVVVVSIRFEVRGGFRHPVWVRCKYCTQFQSALRFAVVSDQLYFLWPALNGFNPL